jgi:hypothetical protein
MKKMIFLLTLCVGLAVLTGASQEKKIYFPEPRLIGETLEITNPEIGDSLEIVKEDYQQKDLD